MATENPNIQDIVGKMAALKAELAKVIVGQQDVIDQIIITLLAGGHALLTGVPGLGKTLLVKTVAQLFSLSFKRIQFTPDLMPADIFGTEVLQEDPATGTRAFKFIRGPVFANIVLADEINRTPPNFPCRQLFTRLSGNCRFSAKLPMPSRTNFAAVSTSVWSVKYPVSAEQYRTWRSPSAKYLRIYCSISVDLPTPFGPLIPISRLRQSILSISPRMYAIGTCETYKSCNANNFSIVLVFYKIQI